MPKIWMPATLDPDAFLHNLETGTSKRTPHRVFLPSGNSLAAVNFFHLGLTFRIVYLPATENDVRRRWRRIEKTKSPDAGLRLRFSPVAGLLPVLHLAGIRLRILS